MLYKYEHDEGHMYIYYYSHIGGHIGGHTGGNYSCIHLLVPRLGTEVKPPPHTVRSEVAYR